MSDTPKIYVACLASYNAGHLYGRWLEVGDDVDELREEIKKLLEGSPIDEVAEEHAIHDSEGFAPYSVGEYESLDTLVEIAELKETFGEVALHVVANHGEEHLEHVRTLLEERNEGAWESLEEWAKMRLAPVVGAVDQFRSLLARQFCRVWLSENYRMDNLGSYFNFEVEKWASDLELGGYIDTYEVDGQVHVFWN